MRLRLACLVVLLAVAGSLTLAAERSTPDEKVLADHKVPGDGPALLEFFRKQTTQVLTDAQLAALVEQLGDDDFFKREEASRNLILAGPRSRKHLTPGLKHADLEVRFRATRCLKQIDNDVSASVEVMGAAIRQLARLAPAGAVRALLDYTERAEQAAIVFELRQALSALAMRDGKANPALVAGLRSRSSRRRLAAALALCAARATNQLPALRKLLEDDDAVRLPVAEALARLGQKEAVPVLISFMDRPPGPQTGPAEDVLFHLAGQKSPSLEGPDSEARTRYRRAWEAWWKEHRDRVDLDVLNDSSKVRAHTTVMLLDNNEVTHVLDLDAARNVRWRIDNIPLGLDLQRLGGERVLIAEHRGNRVVERDSKGEVVWEKKITEPLMAQRLPNGNTFIASVTSVIEVDRAGKEVFSYTPPVGQRIMRARKVPGGEIWLVLQLGVARFVRLDRFGKEIRSFGVEVNTSGGRIDVTPAGNVLIPEIYNNRVQERDLEGRIVRDLAVTAPIAALSLPDGHILVTSMAQKRAVEIDRSGKEVWEYRRDVKVSRAVRP
jgi:hypothetical protein